MKNDFLLADKVGSVTGMSVALEASKKSIKIHHDARPLLKS